jgi:TolB-like protein/DNA-binding winged helix-turn-helix (wHTH) protein
MRYQFNRFEIDTLQFKLFFAGKAVAIEPKDFDLIVYLIENRHRAVTRDEIFNALWQGQVVCDATLSNHIKSARKILGDNGEEQNVISTIRGRGYQFVAETVALLDKKSVILPPEKGSNVLWQAAIVGLILLVLGLFIFNINSPKIKTNSIAVLPFISLSDDQNNEYFSDVVSEEILNALSRVSGLHVTSRSSSFYFRGNDIDIPKVAEQLGVTYILEGSVRKSETKVRITVQLIEANNDRQIWGATFNRELVDILAMQTEISTAIIVALRNATATND